MKRFSVLYLLLLIGSWTQAQPKIITVDTTTGVPMESLPFHRPFFLKMLARDTKPIKVYLFEHIRHETLSRTLQEKTIKITSHQNPDGTVRSDTTLTTYQPKKLDNSYFFTKKEGNKLYTYINFRDEYALRPSRQYSIAVYYGATPGVRDVFSLLHQADKLGNSTTDTSTHRKRSKVIRLAVDKYNNIAKGASLGEEVFFGMFPLDYPDSTVLDTMSVSSIEANGVVNTTFAWNQVIDLSGTMGVLPKPMMVGKVQKLITHYQDKVRTPLRAIDKQTVRLDSATNAQVAENTFNSVASQSTDAYKLYRSIDALEVSKVRDAFTQNDNRLLRVVQELKRVNADSYRQIACGLRPLLCSFCKPAKATDYVTRQKNIDETIGDLRSLNLMIRVYEDQIAGLSSLAGSLMKLQEQLEFNRGLLKLLVEADESIVTAIGQSDQFNTADLLSANTFIFSFETRTKYSLVPEVGLLTNRPFKAGRGSNFLLLPYIGATINFSQLDRDVPFYQIRNKTFWDRTGLILGVTLVSVKDSAATPPRDNFFEKSSLVTGLSFRFSNTVKAVFGYNWFYTRATDTGVRSLNNMPFIGLSFDIDVQKYLPGIFGAVTSLKGPIDKKINTESP